MSFRVPDTGRSAFPDRSNVPMGCARQCAGAPFELCSARRGVVRRCHWRLLSVRARIARAAGVEGPGARLVCGLCRSREHRPFGQRLVDSGVILLAKAEFGTEWLTTLQCGSFSALGSWG